MIKSITMKSRALLLRGNRGFEKGVISRVMGSFVLRLRSWIRLAKRKWMVAAFVPAIFVAGLMLFSPTLSVAEAPLFVPENFVLIPGGEFTMGSPEGEFGRAEKKSIYKKYGFEYSETQHQVRVSTFYMSKYAVTVAEFRKFVAATGYRTDAEKGGFSTIIADNQLKKEEGVNWRDGVSGKVRPQSEENHPVLHVSWYDAVAYCNWMTAKTGKTYRLPTEAEREYACRAGTTTPFNTGESLTAVQSNNSGNYPYNNKSKRVFRENTVSVSSFAPNAWGLYNMHGNVYECCSDWFGDKYYEECKSKGIVENPPGPETGLLRVIRGGSWMNYARACRSAYRIGFIPDYGNSLVGFRLVLVP